MLVPKAAAAQITDDAFSDDAFGRAIATTTNEGHGMISVFQELKGREVTFADQKCVPVWSDKPVEALNAVLETLMNSPADAAYLAFLINGRDMHRDDACHSMARAGSGSMSFYGVWFNDNEESTAAWASQLGALLSPLAEGFYVNEVDCFRHPEQVEKSYTADNWQRLQAINKAYDPDGLFHTFPGFGPELGDETSAGSRLLCRFCHSPGISVVCLGFGHSSGTNPGNRPIWRHWPS